MTGQNRDLAAVIRQARSALAGYGTGSGTARQWAPVLADRLRDLLAAVNTVPADVDQAALDALPLSQAIDEIEAAHYPGIAFLIRGWLAGRRDDYTADEMVEILRGLPAPTGPAARDVVVAAVRAREARHAAESASDGDR